MLPSSRSNNNSQPNFTNRLITQKANLTSSENKNNTLGNLTDKDLTKMIEEKKKNIKILSTQQERLDKNVNENRKSKEDKIVFLTKIEKDNKVFWSKHRICK